MMSRFTLQWLMPADTERLTHVMLLDKDRPAPYVVAAGHGAGKVEALLNLRTTLIEDHALPEAIDFVAVAYTRRSGKAPVRQSDESA